jgi:hypothetical protein
VGGRGWVWMGENGPKSVQSLPPRLISKLASILFPKSAQNGSQIQVPNLSRIGPKSVMRSTQNQTKLDLKIGLKSAPKLSQYHSAKLGQNWPQNYPKSSPKASPKSPQKRLKIVSKSAQNQPKIVSKSGVDVGGCGWATGRV